MRRSWWRLRSEVVEGNGENDKWKWEGMRDAHGVWFSDTLRTISVV